jgi:Rrf2 family protein
MNFTRTTSYSLRILNFIACRGGEIVSAASLHESLDIPYSYMRQVLSHLSDKGFITGGKGRNGGYRLSRDAKSIYLSEIVEKTEGLDSFNRCLMGVDNCTLIEKCALHNTWVKVKSELLNVLNMTNLLELSALNDKQ